MRIELRLAKESTVRCMDACMPAPAPAPALTNLSQVVISESMAQNYALGISVVEFRNCTSLRDVSV